MSVKIIFELSVHVAIIIPILLAPGRCAIYSIVAPEYVVVEIEGSTYSDTPNIPVFIDPVNTILTVPAFNKNAFDSAVDEDTLPSTVKFSVISSEPVISPDPLYGNPPPPAFNAYEAVVANDDDIAVTAVSATDIYDPERYTDDRGFCITTL
jgi:hypothetical protein